MSLMPAGWKREDIDQRDLPTAAAVAFSASILSSLSSSQYHSHEEGVSSSLQLQRLVDESLMPAPLVLPPIRWSCKKRSRHLDDMAEQQASEQEQIRLLLWWPEEDIGGPRLLFAATAAGTAVVFEIPPAVCAMYPVPRTKMSMEEWDALLLRDASRDDQDASDATATSGSRMEYEVNIIPDPDHGLGLRLECMEDGQPAIAGSFKKNPITGDTLPAERAAGISLGDELVSANGIILDEGQSFDTIISTVRELGASCGGNPIRMRFRRMMIGRSRLGSATSERSQRRSMEDMLGLSPSGSLRKMMSSDAAESPRSTGRSGGSAGLRPPPIIVDSPPVVEGGPSQDNEMRRHGSIVGLFSVIEGLASALESNEPCNQIALVQASPHRLAADEEYHEPDSCAILVTIAGSLLHVSLLELVDDYEYGCAGGPGSSPESAKATLVGSFPMFEKDSDETCLTMQVVNSSLTMRGNRFCISFASSKNLVRLVVVEVDRRTLKASFAAYDVAKLHGPVLALTIRAYSADLIATMQSPGQTISVWSSRPHPGCSLNSKNAAATSVGGSAIFDYSSSLIQVETSFIGNNSRFVDFSFIDSGFLDSSPTLIGFSLEGVTAYHRLGGSTDWLPMVQVHYSALLNGPKAAAIKENENPQDRFPHLIAALRTVMSSHDERHFLRSDWHPDTLLAHICTDKRGADNALRTFAHQLFLWLCGEGKDIPEDAARCRLLCAGLPIVLEEAQAQSGKDSTKDSTPAIDSVSGLMSALSIGADAQAQKESFYFDKSQSESMRRLQAILFHHLSPGAGASSETLVDDLEIPAVLCSMRREDIHILWAIGQVMLEPPDFRSLDVCGQLFMFATSLFHKMKVDLKSEKENQPSRFSTFSFARKLQPSPSTSETIDPAVASSACLSALMSGTQGILMERVRVHGSKMDWPMLKELRAPFWIRSDKTLARLSEEIGQTIFREKRDILECAIFFIISGKMRTLKNLAATDCTESGKKFFKFLTGFDFSSERGRRAAEKNAFSLLRKCRFTVASAFFLLAEPPLLQSALETIAGKSEDLDLAFLVGRLMESKEVAHGSVDNVLGFSSGGLLGTLGGGAGYAGSGAVQETFTTSSDDIKFGQWTPRLGKVTKKLLVERLIPMASGDNALTSTLLLWANKREESAWWLPGFIEASFGSETGYRVVDDVGQRFFARLRDAKGHASTSRARSVALAFQKANALIDFASIPLMLSSMKASPRARDAASLVVSAALISRGVEVPPLLSCWLQDVNADEARSGATTRLSGDVPTLGKDEELHSSIFAGFDGPPKKPSNGMASSSIFDSFDAPPRPSSKSAIPLSATSQGMQSSIFDSFEVPSPAQPKVQPVSGGMQSSIFDSFDVAAPKPKPVHSPTTTSDGMQSSVFDSFDAPKPTPASPVVASGAMHSSIFDSFDVPAPPTTATRTTPTAPSGEMQSSIFDSFETPPKPKPSSTSMPSTPAATNPNTSIFYSFETAPGDSQRMLDQGAADQRIHDVKAEIPEPEVLLSLQPMPTPQLWSDLHVGTMELGVARRLLRELASILAYFHFDQSDQSVETFFSQPSLVPSGAAEILQIPCDSEQIIERVLVCLESLSTVSCVEQAEMVHFAVRLLGGTSQPHRTLFAVVLYSAIDRHDLAEAALRSTASSLIHCCNIFAFAYDDLVQRRATRFSVSSLHVRRQAAIMSWQLETCLWFHRGGGLPISGVALKEAIIAVRCGLLVASWNRNYESLEAMLRNDPDCLVDEQAGRHLWTSLRATSSPERVDDKQRTTTSGGWEFLVDCRRSEATVMLRGSPTGSFIIRPHPNDHGVFTLSFKTNLVPTEEAEGDAANTTVESSADQGDESRPSRRTKKAVKKDDVVQHAIIRLSDSGFRCGSFGPFTSLLDLLESVSTSLPFKLRFDLPPTNRVIQEEGSQPSPNAVLFRKLALSHSDSLISNPPRPLTGSHDNPPVSMRLKSHPSCDFKSTALDRQKSFGSFLELLVLSKIRRQLSSVASVHYDSLDEEDQVHGRCEAEPNLDDSVEDSFTDDIGGSNHFAIASWIMGPLLSWCRSLEVRTLVDISPGLKQISESVAQTSNPMKDASEQSIEMTLNAEAVTRDGGDAALRRMIQRGSGVEFSTLRLVDGGECTMVVLFSRNEAIQWLLSSGSEQEKEDAVIRLEQMEKQRVIEPVDLSRLPLKQKSDGKNVGVRYRFVDPWEVEALSNRDGETKSASLGRERYVGFSFGRVALSCESIFRSLGGLPLLELWTSAKGGVVLTRALATIYPPWERAAGGDLQVLRGIVTEPDPFTNSIRQHLYRNALFRRLELPQRFVALVQVELLDLKNLSSPSGTVSLTVYALLRIKRRGSNAVLSNKTRTLDTALTQPVRLSKQSAVGPHAPASWGSVVRFRFPLPEGVSVEGESFDSDREVLFKGPPSVLQVSVYEKKLLVDHALGTADINTDGLFAGGQLEEWVPLRSEKSSIHWFARIRLTLRYELMCTIASGDTKDLASVAPSVALARIDALSRSGGVSHEDHKRSISSPDLLGYLESMVY